MSVPGNPDADRLAELRATAEAIGALAKDRHAFRRALEAFRAHDAAAFQAELAKAGLLERCRLICRWLCSKHCVVRCRKLCLPFEKDRDANTDFDPDEIHAFAEATARLATDTGALRRLLDAAEREDADAFRKLIEELKLQRFCHQLCHWLCAVRCRRDCHLLCPPPPTITEVGNIPTSQFDGAAYASGPSVPPGYTPAPNPAGGVGHHPFGGLANIRGVFSVASPTHYKVEVADAPGGPWTPILQPVGDFRFSATFPTPLYDYYTRLPAADGWYAIAEMGLAGADYLTDWPTGANADGVHYLKLTVRAATMTEFGSPVVAARVDNTGPAQPVIQLQLQAPDGSRRDLGCCERVERGDGNLVVVKLQASDANFSGVSVTLMGGCGWSSAIVATDGTPLSKTYNGNTADTGYPALTEFLWDPWTAKVEPCCYLIDVRISDRAIVNNYLNGHANENWQSLTIG